MTDTSILNELEPYLPSSSEKKQAVMMYMLVGLVLSMGKREVSPYMHHHIKQSLGWIVFLVFVVLTDLLLIIMGLIFSLFLWLAFLITLPTLSIGVMGLYQAQQGKYIRESEMMNKFFLLFSGVGNWTLNLFEANKYQIIDANMYRSEEQFYTNNTQAQSTVQPVQDSNVMVGQTQIIPDAVDLNSLQNQNPQNYTPIENQEYISDQIPEIIQDNVQAPIQNQNGIQMEIQNDISINTQTDSQISIQSPIENNQIVNDSANIDLNINQINNQNVIIGDTNSLDNNLQIPISNGNIGVDLSDSTSVDSSNQVQN